MKNTLINITQAINIFYQKIKYLNKIPCTIKIPNKETRKVIEESQKSINVEDFSFDELERKKDKK